MYQKSHFDKCYFNPLEKSLLKTYPRLSDLLPTEVDENDPLQGEGEALIRYILSLYDPRSPLIKDYPDLNSRKMAAAEIAGYALDKDKEKLELLYACDSEYMVGIIVSFLRNIVQSRLWASLQADEQTFWEFVFRLLLPIGKQDKDKDMVSAVAMKTKLSEDKEDISSRVEKNWNRYLGDDDDLKKKIEKKPNWTPESMAGVK